MINIVIAESMKAISSYSAFISFPYNKEHVEKIKSLPMRYWNSEFKDWEIPLSSFKDFLALFSNVALSVRVEGEDLKCLESNIPPEFKFKTKPFGHQVSGLEYGLKKDKFLLGDEQGLGKTKQIIDMAVARKIMYGYKHCLIICCINGLKWNWYEEVKKHSNEKPYVIGQRYVNKKSSKLTVKSNKDKLDDLNNLPPNYFLMTNIETLRDETIAKKLQQLCDEGTIDMLVVDEIHKCSNPSSQQSKGLLKLSTPCMIAATGTPIVNRPLDAFTILKWLNYTADSFTKFKKHYCVLGGYGGYDVVGYRNMKELKTSLDNIQLRRLKKDVLDLPPKIYVEEFVEMTPKQEKIYKEVYAQIMEDIDRVRLSPSPLAEIIRLRQATGYTGILSTTIQESAKLNRMMELVRDFLDQDKKVLIYSNWTSITDQACAMIAKEFGNNAVLTITGKNKGTVNKDNEKSFMTDDNVKVLIGTIGALGTGYTLTAATVEIFLDEPWNKKIKEQAEDRAHRIGTTDSILIITLLTKNTIDERINQIVYEKGVMADTMTDGDVDNIPRGVLTDFLLS